MTKRLMTKDDIKRIAAAVAEALGGVRPLHEKEFLSMDEAAQYTGIAKNTLYKMTHNRQIPYSKPSGKLCFFRRSDLEAWMMSNPVAVAVQTDTVVSPRRKMNKSKIC
ncbi:MAG: helix-turn-helix domain-containing protein [Pseudoflavonifractor sp.]|nr:helix-turn-helix domain-containing protein [Pseudoflavonifractor sp.]